MADNVQADAGTTGEIFATDDILGVHYPWVKLAFGADDGGSGTGGTATQVETGVGLPVTLQASHGTDIGDVDIASFPAGNLGAQAASASLSVTLATDEGATAISGAVTATLSSGDAETLGAIKTNTVDIPNVIAAPNATPPSKVLSIAGNDGTNLRAVKVSSEGRLSVDVNPATQNVKLITVGDTEVGTTSSPLFVKLKDGTESIGKLGSPNADTYIGDVVAQLKNSSGTEVGTTAQPLSVKLTTSYQEDQDSTGDQEGNASILLAQTSPHVGDGEVADGKNVAQRGTRYGAAYTQIVDSSGGYVDTFGGGTQYTEDLAAATDPVGTAQILVAHQNPGTEEVLDGRNVAQRGTRFGAAYTQIVDSSGAFVDTFGGGTQYTEDVQVGESAIVGTATMMERDDALESLTPVAGDWASLRCTAEGALWVQDFNSDSIRGVLDNLDLALNTSDQLDVNIAEGGFDGKLTSPDAGTYIGKVDIGTTSAGVNLDTIDSVLDEIKLDTEEIETAVEKIDKAVHVDDATFTLDSHSGVMMMGYAGTQSASANRAAALSCDTDGSLNVKVSNPFGGAVTGTFFPATQNVKLITSTETEVGVSGEPLFVKIETGTAEIGKLGSPAAGKYIGDVVAEISGQFDDTETASVDENAFSPVRITGKRGLHSNLRNNAGGEVGISGAPLFVELEQSSAAIGNVDVSNGGLTEAVNIQDGGNKITVDWNGANPPIGAGTEAAALRVTLATDSTGLVAVNLGDNNDIQGQGGYGVGIVGKPVRIGASATTTEPAAVTDTQTTNLVSDLNGKLVTMPYAVPERLVRGSTDAITGTTVSSVIAAAASGLRNYVTSVLVTNSHATTGTLVELRNGTSDVICRGYAAPAGGGFSMNFASPLRGTAATAVNAYNLTDASNTYVSASGYVAP